MQANLSNKVWDQPAATAFNECCSGLLYSLACLTPMNGD